MNQMAFIPFFTLLYSILILRIHPFSERSFSHTNTQSSSHPSTAYTEQAWGERDAALLREQNAQTQMHTMRDKLKQIEKETRKTETSSRDEWEPTHRLYLIPDECYSFCCFLLSSIIFRPGMSLTKQKESLLRDRDRLTAEIEELNKRVQQYQIQNDTLEKKRIEYEEKCRDLYKLLDVRCLRL